MGLAVCRRSRNIVPEGAVMERAPLETDRHDAARGILAWNLPPQGVRDASLFRMSPDERASMGALKDPGSQEEAGGRGRRVHWDLVREDRLPRLPLGTK